MDKKVTKKAKILYIVFGIVMFAVVISALIFMTQYKNVRVNIADGVISEDAALNGVSQKPLYRLFQYKGKAYENGFPEFLKTDDGFAAFAQPVFDYRLQLDAFNTEILWFGIVGLIFLAIMLIFSNHNRNIYYMSNVITGVLFPLAMAVWGVVIIIQNIGLMSTLNNNKDLFNLVAIGQNQLYQKMFTSSKTTWDELAALYTVNSATFLVYLVFFAGVVGYSAYMAIYALKRYKSCAEDRRQVLIKAGVIND